MAVDTNPKADLGEVRPDFVPKSDFLSEDFARLERERLWPRVWQIACRHEEIPNVGDFVTYDILDDSIIIVRAADESIRAYHNACPHRGRRLTEDCGNARQFACKFHGWRFNLDGRNIHVPDRDDWGGCLRDEDISLAVVRAESWGGWVWINMDPNAQPLHTFLAPVIERCGRYNFENLRFRWYKTVGLDCNWKTVIEAFDEAYHVAVTHPELLAYTEDYTESKSYGPHGALWMSMKRAENGVSSLQPSRKRGGAPPGADYRKYIVQYVEDFDVALRAMVTSRTTEATRRLLTEVSAEASQLEVTQKWMQFQREAAESEGITWPDLSPEYMMNSHQDWHVFPNTIFLHASVDGVLWYRARPDAQSIDKCIFDVWSLELYAPGKEPKLVRESYTDWREADVGRILTQDFTNIPEVQRGMKSRGFRGLRTNPVQEVAISNFHRALRDVMSKP